MVTVVVAAVGVLVMMLVVGGLNVVVEKDVGVVRGRSVTEDG